MVEAVPIYSNQSRSPRRWGLRFLGREEIRPSRAGANSWVETRFMKELIGMALFVASMFADSSYALRQVHDIVRAAALRKVAKGLPPVPRFQKPEF